MSFPVLNLTNTLTRKKEPFKPLQRNNVLLYVCGVTPYDYSHIGHGRSYVNFDVLVRLLRFLDYKVKYVRNVTDIDDKLLKKAQEQLGDQLKYPELAQKFTKSFQDDMHRLNCIDPDVEPLVTENIEAIIVFIQGLIDAGKAYAVETDVYFEVKSLASYGQLSGKKLEDLKVGARVQINEKKKDPADFALWKGNKEGLFWKSPWGFGRPGWHIECSVLAKEYLGKTIDIHGGGSDLIFPHHENERAQSEGLHDTTFVRFWLHNALLNLDKEKMSKSLGNIFALRDIFESVDPMVLRFYFLQHHYRTPIEFSLEKVRVASVAYKKLVTLFRDVPDTKTTIKDCENNALAQQLIAAVADDLNTPKFIGLLFEHREAIKRASTDEASIIKSLVCTIFGVTLKGVTLEALNEVEVTSEIEDLIKKREQARHEKKWELADSLRDQLHDLGYKVKDGKVK